MFHEIVEDVRDVPASKRLKPMPPNNLPPYHVVLHYPKKHPLARIYEAIFLCRMAGMDQLENDDLLELEVAKHWSAFLDMSPSNQQEFVNRLPGTTSCVNSSVLEWSLMRHKRDISQWKPPPCSHGMTLRSGSDEIEIILCDPE